MLSNNAAATAGKGENLLHLPGASQKKGTISEFPTKGYPPNPRAVAEIEVLCPGALRKKVSGFVEIARPVEKLTKKVGEKKGGPCATTSLLRLTPQEQLLSWEHTARAGRHQRSAVLPRYAG
jgi:hypothetical protein